MFWQKKKKPKIEAKKRPLDVTDLLRVQMSSRRCPPVQCACIDCPKRYNGIRGGCEFLDWHKSLCSSCRMNISQGIDVGYMYSCSVKKALQGELNYEKKEGLSTDDIRRLKEPNGARLPSIDEILF